MNAVTDQAIATPVGTWMVLPDPVLCVHLLCKDPEPVAWLPDLVYLPQSRKLVTACGRPVPETAWPSARPAVPADRLCRDCGLAILKLGVTKAERDGLRRLIATQCTLDLSVGEGLDGVIDGHRFSGYPGAWCLDCGLPDQREECLALCDDRVLICTNGHVWCGLDGPACGAPLQPCPLHTNLPCLEPGSNRCNPYHRLEAT